jgi:hypothetical protein
MTSFLPSPIDTLLLRASLLPGSAAADSWLAWCRIVGDPVQMLGTDARHIKVLVPQLGRNLRASGVTLTPMFRTYARAAHFTETRRVATYQSRCRIVLELLNAHAVPHLVLKGAALAETMYADPALRHAHDFDLLLREADLYRAADVLLSHRFTKTAPLDSGPRHHLAPLRDEMGLSVELHRALSYLYAGLDTAGVFSRSVPATIAGVPSRVLSRADALVHAGVHAIGCAGSQSFRWVTDAWVLLDGMTPADWQTVVDVTSASNVALPMMLTLGYLADALDAPVPADVLERLQREAIAADRVSRSAATFGVRQSLPQGPHDILRSPWDWRARAAQLAWRLLPPPRHVRWAYGVTRGWTVPFYYPYRFAKLASGLVRTVAGTGGEPDPA